VRGVPWEVLLLETNFPRRPPSERYNGLPFLAASASFVAHHISTLTGRQAVVVKSGRQVKHWIKVKNRKHHAFDRVQEAH
jgi:hypothetical protein